MLKQAQTELTIETRGQGLYEFTEKLERWLQENRVSTGQVTLFCRHTSCSLTIQENADPDVQIDLQNFFTKIAPENESWYRHICEGPDDMPAHIKSVLTDVNITIPIAHGRSVLGTWQGIYLFEHRHAPHRRHVVLHYLGD